MTVQSREWRFIVVPLLWLMVSCSDSPSATQTLPPPNPAATVVAVRIVADSVLLSVGSQSALRALALNNQAGEVAGKTVQWQVDDPSVLSVSGTGTVTALAKGVARVIATVDGISGEAAVGVYVPAVATVAVALDSVQVAVGSVVQARATPFDNGGKQMAARPVQWAIAGDPTVASITSTGLITALAKGSVTIQATIDTIVGNATLNVVALGNGPVANVNVTLDSVRINVGSMVQGRVVTTDADGNLITGRPVQWSIVGDAAVATVSASGLVTAVATGTVQVRATVDGIAGLVPLEVVQPPPVDQAVLPELPKVQLTTTYVPATGRTIVVRAGDNLQAALNAARRGDELVLDAGSVFRGNFILPKLAGTAADGWVIVRSSQLAALPEGNRATNAQASSMARLETINGNAVIATALGASGWRLAGLEVTINPAFTGQQNGLVLLGDGSSAQRTASDVASDLILDRMYIHGTPTSQVKRCVALNSARSAVIDSYLVECHGSGFDAQAIVGWNGPGPFKIENNTLSGSGENVMFGGADAAINGLIPSDIEIRRNYFYTPVTWRGVWSKKNLFELKAARRLLVENNVFDGSWLDGQVGYAFVLKSENQSGQCTWCRTSDVTIRGNVIRNVGAAFSLAGREGSSPNPVGDLLTRVLIQNNVVESVNVAPFVGDARLFLIQNDVRDATIRNNTLTTTSSLNSFLYLGRASAARRFFFERNIVTDGRYGLFGDALGEGTAALAALSERVSLVGNQAIGPVRAQYPSGIAFVVDVAAARAVAGSGADDSVSALLTSGIVIP